MASAIWLSALLEKAQSTWPTLLREKWVSEVHNYIRLDNQIGLTLMENPYYRPRIATDVTVELKNRFDKLLHWGQHNNLHAAVLEQVADMLECADSSVLIALIIDKRVRLRYELIGDKDGRPINSQKA